MAFTKTHMGNGWVKLQEASPALAAGETVEVTSSAITGDDLNDIAKAGGYGLQVHISNTGTVVADTSIHMIQDDMVTYAAVGDTDAINNQSQNSYRISKRQGAPSSPGIKFNTKKDSGTGEAIVTWTVMYYAGGPAGSDLTIGGVGADPS